MKRVISVVIAACVAFTLDGCGGQNDTVEKAKADWAAFVNNVKATIPAATEAENKSLAENAPVKLRMEHIFLRDDVKQSDSLKYPYVGDITIELKMFMGVSPTVIQ